VPNNDSRCFNCGADLIDPNWREKAEADTLSEQEEKKKND
jgi:hypothetical protein